jgi:hypothetical protein
MEPMGETRDVDQLREEIEAIILRDSENLFDDPEERSALELTVRVCCEFFNFLRESNDDTPDSSEANYIVGTIRAHVDEYFSMEQCGRILSGLELQEGFLGDLPKSFGEFKAQYEKVFKRVLDSKASAEAFGLLLSLTKLMLLFLTVYFRSFQSYSAPEAADS